MGSFEDRRDSFERKYALDEELKFKATARRAKLVGLWAADILGKQGDERDVYAKTIVHADLEETGDEDLFRKLRSDFDQAGVQQSDHQIRRRMSELLEEAIQQIKAQ